MKRPIRSCAALAAALLARRRASGRPPANVAAEVNGHAITYAELEKAYQSQYPQQVEGSNEDQVMSQKLEVLGSMITNEIMLQRAEKLGLTAVDADVEAEFNKMKAPYTKEEFEKQLADRHMTVEDLKAQIRRELTVNKLINKEITSHITITDADVDELLQRQQGELQSGRAAGPHGADPGHAVPRPQRAQPEEQQGAERRRGPARSRTSRHA